MSSNFYFRKWKSTIADLEILVKFDIDYQVTKAHDQTECQAVQRLCAVLGRYIAIYNNALECIQQNLQVQKTKYMKEIIKTVVSRIIELKHELKKINRSQCQFFGKGLVEWILTIDDIEINEIPDKLIRVKDVQSTIDEILQSAKRKALANPEIIEEVPVLVANWWDIDEEDEIEEVVTIVEDEPEELRKTREMVTLIQAHEKSRQHIQQLIRSKHKRAKWEMILKGTLQPEARYDDRLRSAEIIKNVLRVYFKIKRQKVKECKRDELLGINICVSPKNEAKHQVEEMLQNRARQHDAYEAECKERSEKIKDTYLARKRDALIEDYRDQIRDWFSEWFERILFIHDIPNEGSAAIFKGDIPEPEEWLEEYRKKQIENQANKNKSALQKKFEKLEAMRELKLLQREEKLKKKAEDALMKKIMKNPTMHPGYYFPQSKKTDHILQVIEEYHRIWDQYDAKETLDVKEKYIEEMIVENAIMEAKLEVLPIVDQQMENEFLKLITALKEDYIRNEMKIPELIKKGKGARNKTKKVKDLFNQEIVDKIEDLVTKGFIKEYPKTKLEDFIGDPNFAGEDLRCNLQPTHPFNGEIRNFWWDRCRELTQGFHRILLVGPKGSGKTKLVNALASVNNAMLFELDPIDVQGDFLSAAYLQQLVLTVVACAKAIQPCVIHIKHIEKLFYKKVPSAEAEMCLDMIKNFFIRKLFRRILKTDNITVVGTCINPWVVKSRQILKQFPIVMLLPNTTYSIVVQILKEWVLKYNVIPANFNGSNLAYALQGYSFGYLKEALEKFMTGDRIVRIAAYGLNPMDVYDYIMEDSSGTKTEYNKYEKWYYEKTTAGVKEAKHLQEQKEFKLALEKFVEKSEKKKKAAASKTSSKSTLV